MITSNATQPMMLSRKPSMSMSRPPGRNTRRISANDVLLVRIVVERVAARDRVEQGVGERHVLAVTGHVTHAVGNFGCSGFVGGDSAHRGE